ncbi:hypothetical protein D3C72_1570520 [compost metagenome]
MVHQLAEPCLQTGLRSGAQAGLARLGRHAAGGLPARLAAAAGRRSAAVEAPDPGQAPAEDHQGSRPFPPGQSVAHPARPALHRIAAPAGYPLHPGRRPAAGLLRPAEPAPHLPDHPEPGTGLPGVQRLPVGDAPRRHRREPLPHPAGRVAGQAHQHALPLAAPAAPHHAVDQGGGGTLLPWQ